MKPIALVIPWYGDEIKGGAEQECNYLAHSLKNAGADVEVLTTCVREASEDRGINTLEEGEHIESGIFVRRFKVRPRDMDRFVPANLKIYHGQPVTLEEEKAYFEEDINSPDLYEFIRANKDNYKCFIFIPYMYGPTYNGSKKCPDNCIMIPCLHDESYAYLRLTKKMMERMRGLIFHAEPEYLLAKRLYDLNSVRVGVLGEGIDTEWHSQCSGDRFRQNYGISGDFILFAGRKDAGKRADELVRFFCRYMEINPHRNIKLVFIGGGSLDIPDKYRERICDLGFVSVEDKHDAFAAASFLCNPSWFESFSLVVMESWIAKRPVLVSEHCAVTTNFCLEANGGLYFRDFLTFAGTVDYLLDHEDVARKMGENGFRYVMDNFTHEVIGRKYLGFIEECLED
jgi:glycosyltransferase involved in cell wall biosynthesis